MSDWQKLRMQTKLKLPVSTRYVQILFVLPQISREGYPCSLLRLIRFDWIPLDPCKSLQVFAAQSISPAPLELMFDWFVDHSCCFSFRAACLLWRDFFIVPVRIQVPSWGLLNLLTSFLCEIHISSLCLVHLSAIRCAGARALL